MLDMTRIGVPSAMTTHAYSHEARAQRAWQAGRQLTQRGRWSEAAERFRMAMRLQPQDPLYPMMLGQTLLKVEDLEGALEAVVVATRLQPDNISLVSVQAQCLKELKRHEELVALVKQVPESSLTISLLNMLGDSQVHLGRPVDAVHTWLKALALDPTNANMHLRLGYAFHDLTLKREAIECLKTALALGAGKGQASTRDLLYLYEREVCEWQASSQSLEQLKEAVRAMAEDAAEMVNPFAFAVVCDDPAINLKVATTYARFVEQSIARLSPRKPELRPRIRVGYVSADFCNHATSILMAELLERHDRSKFEIFLYSHGQSDASALEHRVKSACEHFVDQRDATLPEMIRRIRADEIDILVDLKGYTKESRFQLFAARPAPVQVSYLGFPGSSGASFIDYIIGDPWVTPLTEAAHYSEKIAQMPICYQCNDGQRPLPVPARRADLGLSEEALVLCGFNQPYKISPEVFDVWCGFLRRIPNSVLWLLEWGAQAPPALRKEAAMRGIDPARLVFADVLPAQLHLNRMTCADIFLDTWPCNGHTTVSDALWAGLPVVTFSGRTFASRVAGSLVRAVGLPELACESLQQYEDRVWELCADASRRRELRARIEASRTTSLLFSGEKAARDLERLYGSMWSRALAGLAPEHLAA